MARFGRRWWFAPTLATLSVTWAASLGAAPSLAQTSGAGAVVASLAYVVGSIVCHQRPERSFHLAGAQLPVCARCTGLYVGGAIGILLGMIWRRIARALHPMDSKQVVAALIVAAAPTALTVATAIAGIWDPANPIRAGLALPLGIVAGVVLAAVASNDLS